MPPGPVVRAIGTSLWAVWPEDRISLEFSRISEHTETVTAELQVVAEAIGEVLWTRFNLLAQTARGQVAKACAAVDARDEWSRLIDASCKAIVRALRAGSPPVALEAVEPIPEWVAERWLVRDLIPRQQITVLYAEGGSMKSWLALATAVAGIQGHALSSSWVVGPIRRALYLDWESSLEDHAARLWALTAARETLLAGSILYHRLHRALTDHVDQVSTLVDREGIDFVITDSLGAAAGSEPETNDAALRTFGALRSIKSTHLVLAHVSKAMADIEGPRRPFGGVYVVNTARSTIEARRAESAEAEDTATVTLYHRKSNAGKLAKPIGLAFAWDDAGRVVITGARADLAAASLTARVIQALRDGQSSAKAIAEDLGTTPNAVRTILGRLEKRNTVAQQSATLSGRGQEVQWFLIDTKRNTEEL